MGIETGIGWTNSTFNAAKACVPPEDSPECDHCYAAALAKRNAKVLGVFGSLEDGGKRVVAAEKYWGEPKKWNAKAIATGTRHFVFCESLGDVFEQWDGPMVNHKDERLYTSDGVVWGPEEDHYTRPLTMDDVRFRLARLWDATPGLTWQVLTKRPENILRMWPVPTTVSTDVMGRKGLTLTTTGPSYRHNVWLGTTCGTQRTANRRIPELLKCSDLSPVLWLSCEPLLECLDLEYPAEVNPAQMCCSGFECGCMGLPVEPPLLYWGIRWVVGGCESGPGARPTEQAWLESLRDQCERSNVPYFNKQMMIDGLLVKQLDEMPEGLRIQQWPAVVR